MDIYFGYCTPLRPVWTNMVAKAWPSVCFNRYWDGYESCDCMYRVAREFDYELL